MYGSMPWYAMIPLVCGCVGCSGWVWIHVMKYMIEIKQPVGKGRVSKVLWAQMLDFIHFCIIYLFVPMVLATCRRMALWYAGVLPLMVETRQWSTRNASAPFAPRSRHWWGMRRVTGWNCFEICQTYLFLSLFGAFMSYIITLCMCIWDLWKREVSKQEYMNKPQIPAKS